MKIHVKAFGAAGGLLWGLSLFIWTLLLALTGIDLGRGFLELFIGIYPAYSISVVGAFAGLLIGFLDAGIGFLIFALLYNWLSTKLK